ncbi:hypothetical protein [Okeania sp.]|uniref:hypothetical protein n=1 Tax=Okeania sp. TaxID=3100323 RepID=UPI002B4B1AD0|nr:hypothetical protein [Okeania sp.]MEB3339314.1 hypothetical protein [Okeania sp.]
MFIGGLFAGIFGILPFGKKSEYLLEFDKTEKTSTPKAESTPATVATPAPTKTETEPASSETPKEAKPKVSSAKKAQKVKTQQSKVSQAPAPQVDIINVINPQKKEEKKEVVLFAPNFLMPKPTAKRRRPGPSMGMFRGIAKDMNLPR